MIEIFTTPGFWKKIQSSNIIVKVAKRNLFSFLKDWKYSRFVSHRLDQGCSGGILYHHH